MRRKPGSLNYLYEGGILNPDEITTALVEVTAKNSNYETRRNYISLSHCSLSVGEILDQFENGFTDTIPIRLKCYKGYQMEADLVKRIDMSIGPVRTDVEISAHGGIVKGHPDFEYESYPGDCKSVLMDDWIPKNGKLPRKVYWQMQGYMLYSQKDLSLVIYESREGGALSTFCVRANRRVQAEIKSKIDKVVSLIGG